MTSIQQKCCVFIDNSNLFIEGQKFFARHKNLQVSVPQDIRFRIDIGRMVNALLQGRKKIFAKLYGSEPPPNDSLWQEIRSRGILVDTFKRNAVDCEKELDTSLTADVTEQSCELRDQEPTGSVTFIIIAGDRDYLPSYEKILKHNWKLEIAAWKNCLSHKVKSFAESNPSRGVGMILLDTLVAKNPDIYFLADRWTDHKPLPRDRTIVFEYGKPVEQKEAKQLNSDVTDLIKFPCWYYHPEKDANVVMIIIITDQKEGKYSTDTLYERIKSNFATRCSKIVDLVQFKQDQKPEWQNNVLCNYKYFEDEKEEESKTCEAAGGGGGDESGDGEFQLVGAKRKKPKQKFSDQCIYRFACRDGKNCQYAHTKDEIQHFKNYPENLGKQYKAKSCFFAEKRRCRYQRNPKQCFYAHDRSEARCYNCDRGGLEGVHWMTQCPKGSSR